LALPRQRPTNNRQYLDTIRIQACSFTRVWRAPHVLQSRCSGDKKTSMRLF
jgi:hypothetical protein